MAEPLGETDPTKEGKRLTGLWRLLRRGHAIWRGRTGSTSFTLKGTERARADSRDWNPRRRRRKPKALRKAMWEGGNRARKIPRAARFSLSSRVVLVVSRARGFGNWDFFCLFFSTLLGRLRFYRFFRIWDTATTWHPRSVSFVRAKRFPVGFRILRRLVIFLPDIPGYNWIRVEERIPLSCGFLCPLYFWEGVFCVESTPPKSEWIPRWGPTTFSFIKENFVSYLVGYGKFSGVKILLANFFEEFFFHPKRSCQICPWKTWKEACDLRFELSW